MAPSAPEPHEEISLRAKYWLQLEITINDEQILVLPQGVARPYEVDVDGEPTDGLEVTSV